MRNAKVSKILAASMAATMLLTPATVLADDVTDPGLASSGIEGDGSLEGYVNKEVFRVVLPTIQNVNFTLDPQGLLKAADSTKYSIGPGAVYFENAGSSGSSYSNTSDAIKILNKSSYDVEVGLSVTLDNGDIKLADKAALATANEPSLYLGLTTDTGSGAGTPVAIKSSTFDSSITTVVGVAEAATKGYQLTGSKTEIPNVKPSPNGYYYSYELTDDFTDADAKNISYKLEGACDTKADWSDIATEAVTASVTWSVQKAGLPRVAGSDYSRAKLNNTYTLTNVTQDIKSIGISVDGKSVSTNVPAEAYTLSADKGTLTINGTKAGIGAAADGNSRYFIVTFADDTKMTFRVNVTNTGEFAYSIQNTANTYTLTGNTKEIKSMVISVDGSTNAGNVPAEAYSLDTTDKTALTIDGSKAGIASRAIGQVRYFIITFADDTTTTLSVNVAE